MTKANKFGGLLSLGQDKLDRIETALVKQVPNIKIAAMIQKDWGDLNEIKEASLARTLLRYRKNVIDGHLHETVTKKVITKAGRPGKDEDILEVTKERVFKRYDKKVDAHMSLRELVNLQTARVQKLYLSEEKMTGALIGSMRAEIRELSNLIKQLTELEFDMGLVHRTPKKFVANMNLNSELSQEQHAALLKEADVSDERLEATNKVFELLEELDIEDGDFDEVED